MVVGMVVAVVPRPALLLLMLCVLWWCDDTAVSFRMPSAFLHMPCAAKHAPGTRGRIAPLGGAGSSSSSNGGFAWDGTKSAALQRMARSVDALAATFSTIQARSSANAAMLDRVMVNSVSSSSSGSGSGDSRGSRGPLNQIARVSSPQPNQLLIELFQKSEDTSALKAIEKALLEMDKALVCSIESNDKLKVIVPSLTKDRREQLLKQVKTASEEGKISVRNARRDCIETIKKAEKNKAIDKDNCRKYQEEIQKSHDATVKKIDALWKSKQQSLEHI
jgi:ribosome recycling factor